MYDAARAYHKGGYVRPLPDPDKLPFPGNLIRRCSDCYLRHGCTAPVPGENIAPHEVMIVGQNPGFWEDQENRPFVGQSGRYLDSLLSLAGLPRNGVAITNVIKCLTPENRPLGAGEIKACSHWLDIEVGVVNPRIIVAMGAPAIAHFLGRGAGTVEHLHNRPVEKNSRIILPCYHPAAALRDTSKLRHCRDAFMILKGLVQGADWRDYVVQDEFPPDKLVYRVADTPELLAEMDEEIERAGLFSVDTEQCRGRLWSYQISTRPGTAWFVPVPEGVNRIDLTRYSATAVVHYYLHDVDYLEIADDRFVDTMELAYLLSAEQGLKALAYRLCGINMVDYSEVVHPAQQGLSAKYLNEVALTKWPDPPPIEETKWDNAKGGIVTRIKKPWTMNRKINNILKALADDDGTDLWERWRNIPEEEREVVESVAGPMPQASLMDIPFKDAVLYSARDADATLRVYLKLKQMIEDMNLDFVSDMDHRILPMVHSMMENGMATDPDHYRRLSADYLARMKDKATDLAGKVGHPFNPASSPQVAAVVYGELGFKPTAYTPTKEISTDDQELKKTKHPVAIDIIRYRGIQKLKTTYADNIVTSSHLDAEGVYRFHTKLNTTRVATGRLSSSKTEDGEGGNLQNIPTRNKEAKQIKNGFIAAPGWLLAENDYGQIEVRTQTHLAVCKGLIALFLSGKDPHTTTASRLFNVPYEDAKQNKYRYPCKRAGFGIIYLIGPHGLANQIQEYISDLEMEGEPVDVEPWDDATCDKFINEYYKLYPEIRDYQAEQLAMARRYGYTRDMFGRIRYIPEVLCPLRYIAEAGARQAANFPVTSSAQGIIKAAMGRLWDDLPHTPWAGHIRWDMQIHDSLVLEVRNDPAIYKPALAWVKRIMCNTVTLRVPVDVDVKIGRRWGEMEKLKLD